MSNASERVESTPTEGWKWIVNAPKWHYFRDGRSLCGKWMCLGKSFEQGNDDSPDNCVACRKKLSAEKARAALKLAGVEG